jgi:murein DD-endopeptidase MepM/ murein hydrolase activator NlpD
MLRPAHVPLTRLSLLATLLMGMAACTQTPAMVELKGQNTYGPNGSTTSGNSYASSSYSSSSRHASNLSSESIPTVASAPVATVSSSSIGVSDLSAPTAKGSSSSIVASNTSSASPAPFRQASAAPVKPEALKPAAGQNKVSATTNTNPWTGKPREVELQPLEETSFNIRPQPKTTSGIKEQMVSEVQAKPASETTISKLDSIIGNEGGNQPLESGASKAVTVAKPVVSSGYIWPVSSKKIISTYGPKGKGRTNDGVNIASSQGEPVWAVADGEVVYVGNELKGYGNMVLIKHSGNQSTTYAHLSRPNVDKYDRVRQGDIIGYVGNTGNVKEPQLHFAVREGKDPIDPVKFMKQKVAALQ